MACSVRSHCECRAGNPFRSRSEPHVCANKTTSVTPRSFEHRLRPHRTYCTTLSSLTRGEINWQEADGGKPGGSSRKVHTSSLDHVTLFRRVRVLRELQLLCAVEFGVGTVYVQHGLHSVRGVPCVVSFEGVCTSMQRPLG